MNDEMLDNFLSLNDNEQYQLMIRWLKNHCYFSHFKRFLYEHYKDFHSNRFNFETFINSYITHKNFLEYLIIPRKCMSYFWLNPFDDDDMIRTSDDALMTLINIQWLMFIYNNSYKNCYVSAYARYRRKLLTKIDKLLCSLSAIDLKDMPYDLFFETYFYAQSFFTRHIYPCKFERYIVI